MSEKQVKWVALFSAPALSWISIDSRPSSNLKLWLYECKKHTHTHTRLNCVRTRALRKCIHSFRRINSHAVNHRAYSCVWDEKRLGGRRLRKVKEAEVKVEGRGKKVTQWKGEKEWKTWKERDKGEGMLGNEGARGMGRCQEWRKRRGKRWVKVGYR